MELYDRLRLHQKGDIKMTTGKKIAYIRVSTADQNEARQLEAMKPYEVDKVYLEKASAKDTHRPKLQEMLEFVREDDTVYVKDFSRLARSTKDLLERDINKKLNKELKFCLSDFSQGYPWLLKKLCNHVREQINKGLLQVEISNKLLNAEELFKEDLNGLAPDEESVLRYLAKKVPISIAEIDDTINCSILQSLINKRLLVLVGNKYDIYWDIFRDYLNTGKVPIQEIYYLQIEANRIVEIIELLYTKKSTKVDELKKELALSDNSLHNSKTSRLKHIELAKMLKEELKANWTIETAKVNIKIMMDWLRYAGLTPAVYANKRK